MNLKYTILLVAILTVTLLRGLVEHLDISPTATNVTILLVNAIGLYAICGRRHQLLVGGPLLLATVLANVVNVATGTSIPLWIALDAATGAALLGYFVAQILFGIFDGHAIKGDDILGSICAYLLLAMFWASLFGFVQVFLPDAFAVGGELAGPINDHRLVYFSFVTLSTLGYGDVTPHAPFVQDLAALTAVSGVFYLATLVAVLVSRGLTTPIPPPRDP